MALRDVNQADLREAFDTLEVQLERHDAAGHMDEAMEMLSRHPRLHNHISLTSPTFTWNLKRHEPYMQLLQTMRQHQRCSALPLGARCDERGPS